MGFAVSGLMPPSTPAHACAGNTFGNQDDFIGLAVMFDTYNNNKGDRTVCAAPAPALFRWGRWTRLLFPTPLAGAMKHR
jgi:hypothetical protein